LFKIILIILFFSKIFANNEPFFNYKYDKVYSITNNGSIPLIDGRLDDSCWLEVETIESFTQLDPNYNDIPTEKTTVKIIQDDYAIYIGAKLYDSNPKLIAQKYVNRDDFLKLSMSDWFSISIDSHHDHQTGYEFIVNAAGVQFDSFLFDDTDEEINWDEAWESMVSIHEEGWSIEMRIPFSSLRFSSIKEEHECGINIKRYIHRKNEYIEWIVLPKGTIAGVSKFGHLNNIKNINNETTVEIIPYISMGQMKYDDTILKNPEIYDTDNTKIPYFKTFYYPRLGLDLKIHLSNNTILDFTTLPDFGQIEADPADINFTYYDTYFNEKRRFFLENITLFDTPIDLFHTRRIGENPNYELAQNEETKDALVIGASKITGKSNLLGLKGLSYGMVLAHTMSQERQNHFDNFQDIFSFNLNKNKHNYFVSRLTKDFFSGNSYMGLMLTRFKNEQKESTIFSYDGMYNLLNNRLFLDSQFIYSISDINGLGAFLEFEYSVPNLIQIGSSFEYYDENLDINDIGYLVRNDLLKINNSFIYHDDKMLSFLMVKDFSTGIKHIFSQNNDKLLLGHIFNPNISFNFSNYSFLDMSYIISLQSNEDRFYDYVNPIFANKTGQIPKINTFQIDFGNDPTARFYFDFSMVHSSTSIKESGNSYGLSIGANLSEDSDFSISYSNISGNEKYRFLDQLEEDGEKHFIFSESNNFNGKWVFRYNKFFEEGVNLQLYHEYFIEKHQYSNYSELKESSYPEITDYIEQGNFYNSQRCESNVHCSDIPLDPNLYIWHYPKYNELNLNLILSWEYSQISNIYFIYRFHKAIIGANKVNNYIEFMNYKPGNDLSEIWKDQSVYLKIDYWFDF